MKKYNINLISIEYDTSYLVNRVYIHYQQANKGGSVICLIVTQQEIEGFSDGSAMHYIAKIATKHVGDVEFFDAMADYYSKGHSISKYEPFKIDQKHKQHVHWTPDVVEKYDAQKNLPLYEAKLTALGKKLLDSATKSVEDSGPNMSEIDALPGLKEKVKHPMTDTMQAIKNIIINLNDEYMWTREQVADWLETLDVDLTFKDPDAMLKTQQKEALQKKISNLLAKIELAKACLKNMESEYEETTLQMIELEATLNEQN